MTIGAIIILYNPDIEQTLHSLNVLLPQVDKVYLIDNSRKSNEDRIPQNAKIKYIPLYNNTGIAAAQNTGIRCLVGDRCDFVLFSDQDSIAEPDTVGKLLDTYTFLKSEGIKTGGVGTRAVNIKTGMPYPSKSKEYDKVTIKKNGRQYTTATRCSYIRSSISLIETGNFQHAGMFDEKLFIDGVDNEWCWRASKKGYRFYIAENARIRHMLGKESRKIGNKDISISSEFRIYYQFRNYIWLFRRNYVPFWWKFRHFFKYAVKAVYFPLFVKPRTVYARQIARGIKDGLIK